MRQPKASGTLQYNENVESGPLVTVVISSLNGHRTLPDAVQSALNQTYRNIEVVIVDDGSATPLEVAISGIDDPRIRLFRFEEDRGPYVGRDYAIQRSQGEIIAILDDDDVWFPNKLSTQIPQLLRGPDIGLVCSGAIDVYPGDRKLMRLPACKRISHERLLTREGIINSSVLYRKSTYDKLGGYDVTMRRCGDWDFHIRLSRNYSILAMSQPLLFTYMNPGSQQRSKDIGALECDRFRVIEKHQAEIESRGLWSQTLSFHQYSMGVRYLRAGDFLHARECLIRSLRHRLRIGSLLAIILAYAALSDDFALRQMARQLKRIKRLLPT